MLQVHYNISQVLRLGNLERVSSCYHFIGEYPYSPDVDRMVVWVLRYKLRGEIKRCPAEGSPQLLLWIVYWPAKVAYLDCPIHCHQNILGLDVSVHDILRVKIFNGCTDLTHQSHHPPYWHALVMVMLGHYFEQVAVSSKLANQI